jgi:hypothetical protein
LFFKYWNRNFLWNFYFRTLEPWCFVDHCLRKQRDEAMHICILSWRFPVVSSHYLQELYYLKPVSYHMQSISRYTIFPSARIVWDVRHWITRLEGKDLFCNHLSWLAEGGDDYEGNVVTKPITKPITNCVLCFCSGSRRKMLQEQLQIGIYEF